VDYPFILSTGARQWNSFHSEFRQIPHLRAIHAEPVVQIHPSVANDLGLSEGEWVWLEGPVGDTGKVGRAKRRVEVFVGIDPRVVNTEHGWWHPEGDPEKLYDALELNINNLVSWKLGKTGVGANHKAIPCRIYKVTEGR
jgi:anaerobic selenocysteine-containing dehydrogenase